MWYTETNKGLNTEVNRMARSNADLPARYGRSSDQHLHITKCTFGEQARNKLNKTKRDRQRETIVQCVCALLNSGGGVFSAEIENEGYRYCSENLGGDLEVDLNKLLEPAIIRDFIEFRQSGNILHMYVKSWCSNGNEPRLCSFESGLRRRSGTSTHYIHPRAVLDFLKKKDEPPLDPPANRPKGIQGDEQIYQKAEEFYAKQEAHLGQVLDFGESGNVEFKSFDSEKNLEKRLRENLPKYISAFANTKGGFLFVGADDKSKTVVGCGRGMNVQAVEQMILKICDQAKTQSFHFQTCAHTQKKMNWSVETSVFKVKQESSREDSRYIIGVKVPVFCCAVFEEDPKCWHVENETVTQLDSSNWLKKMQLCDPDFTDDELINDFRILSVKDSPPQCKSVYSSENIEKLQERIFSVKEENGISKYVPDMLKKYEEWLNIPPIESESGPGTLIVSTSWAVDIGLARCSDVVFEALLITTDSYPTLFSWVKGDSPELWKNINNTAFNLKQKLVNVGGYTGRLFVIPEMVNFETRNVIQKGADGSPYPVCEADGSPYPVCEADGSPYPVCEADGSPYPVCKADGSPLYPDSYRLGNIKEVQALLRSLTIVLMSISSPLSDTLGCEFFNLLTEEQFAFLRGYIGIKHLLIYGLPGSGKTLIAIEKIRRMKNSGDCKNTDILFLCENVGLREFVRKQDICLCETRSFFMTKSEIFSSVKHIIVDEGQNFRLEDGDWYKKADSLVKQNGGIFWIFIDYFQRNHTKETGLPPLDSQNEAFLYKVLRNSKKVFDVMSTLIHQVANNSKPEEASHLKHMVENIEPSHSFRGGFIKLTGLPSVESEVVKTVKYLFQQGYSAKDIAVLYSTMRELERSSVSIKREMPYQFGSLENVDQDVEDVVVLDTVRRFSGLERNVVILVDPTVHPFQKEIKQSFLLCAFSRAKIRLYVLESRKFTKCGGVL